MGGWDEGQGLVRLSVGVRGWPEEQGIVGVGGCSNEEGVAGVGLGVGV